MLNFEDAVDETVRPTLVEDEPSQVHDVDAEQTEVPVTVQESPMSGGARILELAATTAERLVADAHAEAESLITTAQTKADAILDASHADAREIAATLARSKEEQTVELERERVTALAGLADEKAALEAQIATLRQLQSDHRSQMRDHLTNQLSQLDAAVPEPPADVND
jgi:cell division septum initiation protein DivIVA